MDSSAQQRKLFMEEPPARNAIVINDRCVLRVEGEHRAVVVAGVVVAHFVASDRMAAAHAMVTLVEQGAARQSEVARAFRCSTRTLRRHEQRFDEGGLAALGRPAGYPRGRPRARARDRLVARLKAEGLATRAIADRLGVDEKSVRKRLRRLGWREPGPVQLSMDGADPNVSAFSTAVSAKASSEAVSAVPPPPAASAGADPNLSAFVARESVAPPSADTDPTDRRFDRLLAKLGVLDDAPPLFGDAKAVPGAGVLLALPSLAQSGVFLAARKVYGSIGPAFYGLRTTILTLIFMALLRIKRPEALKERSPASLGRLLGLDRAPEVKTVRRKLARLAAAGGAARLGRHLAKRRVAVRGEALGFLYVDGHVRVYYGKRRIPKAHIARMHFVMPATTDYWVNDQEGDPLFVVTAEANAGLLQTLPEVLRQVRTLLDDRRVTIVFDRGGWSPKLFAKLIEEKFDILTYRKGRSRRVPRRCFSEHVGTFDGREVRYRLADQSVAVTYGSSPHRRRLRLRQVTRVRDDAQTPVLTSRRDLPAIEVAYRMFERWRQENFFKYLREEYLLDALADYQSEPADPTRKVPNPVRAKADTKFRKAREELARLGHQYGLSALLHVERKPHSSLRSLGITNRKIAREVWSALERVRVLDRKRRGIPARVPIREVTKGPVIQLAAERKHLTNLMKMVAYQAESDLVRALASRYKRNDDEGRTLVQTALSAPGDIEVTETELRVTLAPLSSAHRTRALAALCDELNGTATVFPGTRLRLRYAVAERAGPWA